MSDTTPDDARDEKFVALRKALKRSAAAEGNTKPLFLLPDWRIETGAQEDAQSPKPETPPQSELAARQAQDGGQTGIATADPTMVEEVIDEAVLQEIVAQMVRQELQGAMGEKITHNIRKLVRAELARELQIRKLDGQSSKG